jgi:hypothetical protein
VTIELQEREESLWALVLPPTLWALHFLLSYGTAAVWCAKLAGDGGSLFGARVAIAVYTGLALLAASGAARSAHAATKYERRRSSFNFI